VLAGAVACQYARAFTQSLCPKKYRFPLLRAFSFRLLMADIIRSSALSYPSVSFVPFCIVLRIKALIVLP